MIVNIKLGTLKDLAPYRLSEFTINEFYIDYILNYGNASPSNWYAKRLLGV